MDFAATFRELISRWPNLLFIGFRVVCIALIFEFLAWFLGRRLEKLASPFISLDAQRDPKWRAMRRAALRGTPKIALRTLLYTVALILVLDAFGLQILPLSLAVGSVALLFGAGLLPLLRDYAQGYILLAEDTLAPGDVVEIGAHSGIVERWTLRATWLRDASGRLHVLSNRDVRDVIVQGRAAVPGNPAEIAKIRSGATAFDPLTDVTNAQNRPKK
ncbi:Mechanosensitive ion channel [Abditibacterium utsteinense]|uniref:Mechanosensitive ion channel n=1 Tax=Abditibacterium utsteinense TaxID=1960156 RepID=A0A2S8SWU2_9BACT|nr:mechanosensitive ion channel domain-containing protein [Abditibacterium utsteinense]PQV65219.1 Mechanosensitive ion channel [Abditibacterium utsteinense]